MFELLCMSLLGIAYVKASVDETNEEKRLKEEQRIRDLKIKVFCYAVRHNLRYDEVVKMLQDKTISFEDIDK